MKTHTCLIVSACLAQPVWALFPLLDHIDLRTTYRSATQDWKWELVTAEEDADPAQAYFPARDAEYPDGEKDYRPPGSEWDFLGAGEGEPLWIYVESGDAYSWLGFDNTSAGLQDPVNFTLAGVTGPAGGHFALYRVIGGMPVVFMSTADGISAADLFPKPAGHHHLNWSFTRRGMWAVDLKVSGTRTGGNRPTVAGPTDTARLFFAIGEKAEWRARNFDTATVMDESVAGDLTDPDHDGWPNLLEYAFGGNPRQNGLKRSGTQTSAAPVQGMGQNQEAVYPSITFYQMKDAGAAGIRYAVEWQSGLETSGWAEGGSIHLIENVDAKWERVTVRDSQPAGAGKRFCRIRVEALPQP
ncbi:MAG: hypothetical protein EOP88_19025 [Verrucomicrobiaceae bacterium]|nr:MAG: hypothetical protein EOP88_19025 [Verrucomicrobiaceae bacterium]